MFSLRDIIISKLSPLQIRDICLSYPTVFDEWNMWKSRCFTEFSISPQYFDLLGGMSGRERYLQISSWFTLREEHVEILHPREIFMRAWKKFTLEEMKRVALLLSEEDKNYLIQVCKPQKTKFLKCLFSSSGDVEKAYIKSLKPWRLVHQGYKSYEVGNAYLQWNLLNLGNYEALADVSSNLESLTNICVTKIISSGKPEYLDVVIHKIFSLPQGFSITRDIPKRKFWEKPSIIDFPSYVYANNSIKYDYMGAAIDSYNQQILDFFLSLYRPSKEDLLQVNGFNYVQSKSVVNPENVYLALTTIDYINIVTHDYTKNDYMFLEDLTIDCYCPQDIPEVILLEIIKKVGPEGIEKKVLAQKYADDILLKRLLKEVGINL